MRPCAGLKTPLTSASINVRSRGSLDLAETATVNVGGRGSFRPAEPMGSGMPPRQFGELLAQPSAWLDLYAVPPLRWSPAYSCLPRPSCPENRTTFGNT